MVAEYRSLRASVLRRWHDSLETFTRETHAEQTRFNEAMDEALMESIAHYSMRLDEARDLFLGVLGHDLRNPLGAVVSCSALLMKLDTLDATNTKLATRIWRSGKRMGELISNLLDFTRTRLGIELPLSPSDSDLTEVCRQVFEEVEAYHPERVLKFEARGHLGGYWDVARIGQVVSNLLGNAIQHGDASAPVTLSLAGHDEEVRLCVHSMGPPIPPEVQRTIFEPLIRGKREERETGSSLSSLGIGLYISSEIVAAHGGGIRVDSSDEAGTSFTVRLPRRPNGH
jgi:signal transduction histidine kinase